MNTKHEKISTGLMEAVAPLGDPDDASEALAIYLVGCAVSVLVQPDEERRQETYGLLSELVEKHLLR